MENYDPKKFEKIVKKFGKNKEFDKKKDKKSKFTNLNNKLRKFLYFLVFLMFLTGLLLFIVKSINKTFENHTKITNLTENNKSQKVIIKQNYLQESQEEVKIDSEIEKKFKEEYNSKEEYYKALYLFYKENYLKADEERKYYINEIINLSKEASRLKVIIFFLNKSLKDSQKTIEILKSENEKLKEENLILSAKYKELLSSYNETIKKSNELEQKYKNLTEKYNNLKQKYEKLKEILSKMVS